ncbi:MAG TPA: porin [Casimicrobiaceae bacterium]|nr:porin [Casimicrobiaceae bacterium]
MPLFPLEENFMNKKLVALAVAGAFALPLAAQAQTANVTMYGRLNVDFEFVKGEQADGSNPTVNRLSSNSSRWGVRGTESLGGGLNAIFQIESSINGDTNAGNLGGRETFVGLQGSWGKFTMGRFLMPQDDLHAIFGNAPTLLTSILSTADLWAQGTLTKGQGGFDARTGNSLRYDSPNMSGFTAALQYSTRDSSGNADGTDAPGGLNQSGAGDNGSHTQELRHAWVLGGNVIYANGPLNLGGAFEKNHEVRASGLDDLDWTLTGAYDFGTIMGGFGLRLGLVYERTKFETPTGDLRRDFWGASATVPVGGGKIYLFYGRAGNGKGGAADGTTVGGLVAGPDTASKQWEISYSYSLSPRTLLYTGYVKLNNDCNAKYTFNINAYTINTTHAFNSPDSVPCNGEPSGLVFGMVHFF